MATKTYGEKSSDCSSELLRERALAGDPTVLAELFSCFRSDLLAFLQRRCGDTADAEDAVQDTFAAAARHLSGYRGDAAVKNWIYRIAANACTHMRRGQKNDQRRHEPFDEQRLARAEALGAQAERLLDLRIGSLKTALEALSPQDRAVLLLRDGEGLSTAEVAAALALTESAVKSRLHRARKSVRVE